ncbi:MAG: hypothetical protein AAB947_01775 [Patescibacteria group bacterium]
MSRFTRREISAGAALLTMFPSPAEAVELYPRMLKEADVWQLLKSIKHRPTRRVLMRLLCVDGRNKPGNGLMHTPGAAEGLFLRIWAYLNELAQVERFGIRIPPELVVEAVITALGGVHNLTSHEDCAYCTMMRRDSQKMGITVQQAEDTENLFKFRRDVLPGVHREQAVLIIREMNRVGPHGEKHALAFENVGMLYGVETHVFVHQPVLMKEIIFHPVARNLRACSPELARHVSENEIVAALADLEERHFFAVIKEVAPLVPVYEVLHRDGVIEDVNRLWL